MCAAGPSPFASLPPRMFHNNDGGARFLLLCRRGDGTTEGLIVKDETVWHLAVQ